MKRMIYILAVFLFSTTASASQGKAALQVIKSEAGQVVVREMMGTAVGRTVVRSVIGRKYGPIREMTPRQARRFMIEHLSGKGAHQKGVIEAADVYVRRVARRLYAAEAIRFNIDAVSVAEIPLISTRRPARPSGVSGGLNLPARRSVGGKVQEYFGRRVRSGEITAARAKALEPVARLEVADPRIGQCADHFRNPDNRAYIDDMLLAAAEAGGGEREGYEAMVRFVRKANEKLSEPEARRLVCRYVGMPGPGGVRCQFGHSRYRVNCQAK